MNTEILTILNTNPIYLESNLQEHLPKDLLIDLKPFFESSKDNFPTIFNCVIPDDVQRFKNHFKPISNLLIWEDLSKRKELTLLEHLISIFTLKCENVDLHPIRALSDFLKTFSFDEILSNENFYIQLTKRAYISESESSFSFLFIKLYQNEKPFLDYYYNRIII